MSKKSGAQKNSKKDLEFRDSTQHVVGDQKVKSQRFWVVSASTKGDSTWNAFSPKCFVNALVADVNGDELVEISNFAIVAVKFEAASWH